MLSGRLVMYTVTGILVSYFRFNVNDNQREHETNKKKRKETIVFLFNLSKNLLKSFSFKTIQFVYFAPSCIAPGLANTTEMSTRTFTL